MALLAAEVFTQGCKEQPQGQQVIAPPRRALQAEQLHNKVDHERGMQSRST